MAPTTTLKVDDLHKHYGAHEVLKGVSLEAKRGDVISIIGSSGSGKSTFLRCINFLERPTKGSISLGGIPILTAPDRHGELRVVNPAELQRMRTKLAMVFQHFNLWSHMTVLENVVEAPRHVLKLSKDEAFDRAHRCLRQVGIEKMAAAYPAYLSGGQQQRVAIARALAMEPDALLFDEPTSALDPELVGEVLRVMRQLAEEGRTMIVVTHEMGFARDVSNHVVFLHDGRIEEQGAPKDLFARQESERLRRFLSGLTRPPTPQAVRAPMTKDAA